MSGCYSFLVLKLEDFVPVIIIVKYEDFYALFHISAHCTLYDRAITTENQGRRITPKLFVQILCL